MSRVFSKSAFTLVEMLVVIAIIAVLVAMLLPMLTKARWAARYATCKSNLRQQAVAFNSYAGDYRNWYPHQDVPLDNWSRTKVYLMPVKRVQGGYFFSSTPKGSDAYGRPIRNGVGHIFLPYLEAKQETSASVTRQPSKHGLAAQNHPTMRCPEQEHLLRLHNKGQFGYENNQGYHFYANVSSGIDSGSVKLAHSSGTHRAPTDPHAMLQKAGDTLVLRINKDPSGATSKHYSILSSDHIRGDALSTHGTGRMLVRKTYGNEFYFREGKVMPNYAFSDGSVKDFHVDYNGHGNVVYKSQGTQGIGGDGYWFPKAWAE